jgi:uncharacterized membrane protein YiaA
MNTSPTPQQSLRLIEETILSARRSYQKINFFFLLWGSVFALAGVAAHLLMINGSEYFYLAWPVAALIGGIASALKSGNDTHHTVSIIDRLHKWLWLSYVITLILLIIGAVRSGIDPNPVVLVLTGLPTFTSGAMLRFRPLMFGGAIFWLIGILSFFILREYSSLVYSTGIVLGYIVPGIMLKRQEDGVRTT